MLKSAVDRLRETFAGAGPVEVGQDVGGSLVQCSTERYPWFAEAPAPWFGARSWTGLCRLVSGPKAFNPPGSCQ
jgi:hypothetical protein